MSDKWSSDITYKGGIFFFSYSETVDYLSYALISFKELYLFISWNVNQVLPYSNHTQIIPRTKLATAAVSTLLAHSKSPWWMLNFPSGIHPIIMATTEAKNPTTIAWHWKWNTIHVYQHFYESMWFLNILYCFLVLKVKLYNYQYNIVIFKQNISFINKLHTIIQTCTRAMFPPIIFHCSDFLSMFPKFA